MRIKNGIVICINFDGDIEWKDESIIVFSGKDSYKEADAVIVQALLGLSVYYSARNNPLYIELEDEFGVQHNYDIYDILYNDNLMYSFMKQGGMYIGNHSIEISIIGNINN